MFSVKISIFIPKINSCDQNNVDGRLQTHDVALDLDELGLHREEAHPSRENIITCLSIRDYLASQDVPTSSS